MMEALRTEACFNLDGFAHAVLFDGCAHPWEALDRLKAYLESLLAPEGPFAPAVHGRVMAGAVVSSKVYIGEGAVVEPGAWVKGPAVIGAGTVVRQGAYVREWALVGEGCVVGHSTEIKNSILLDESQAPHFNYLGDSILGRHVNLGAGTKLSNLKNDGSDVYFEVGGARFETGRRKLGAILGDGVATGCNVVTSPGTFVGPRTWVYPNCVLRGVYPGDSIVKLRQRLDVVGKGEDG